MLIGHNFINNEDVLILQTENLGDYKGAWYNGTQVK